MNYNYHTHTYRCRHASGTPEEYIKRAIEGGIRYMGFSEHMPHVFFDGHESGYRIPMADAVTYIEEIRSLREKYKGQIEILVGFEMEYYPLQFDSMLSDARRLGAEYLILGQHFIGEEYPSGRYMFRETDTEEHLREYVDNCIDGLRRGVFSYLAHPDLANFVGDKDVYDREMRRLCRACREMSIPAEINFLGIRGARTYPSRVFWRIAGEEKTPVTFGFDAHDAPSAADMTSLPFAMSLVDEFGLNYIGKPTIIDITK